MLPVLRSLPQRHGGLGLPRHQGTQSEKACLASREHTLEFVNRHRPELLTGTDKWQPVVVGQRTGALYELERELTVEREEELDAALPQDLLVVLAEHKRVWQGVYSRLLTTSLHLAAWFLSSSTHGSGHWMTWRGGSDGRFRFSPAEYIESLRLRLLVAPFSVDGNARCDHCNVSMHDSPLHPLDCEFHMAARTRRHNRVRDLLFLMLKSSWPTAAIGKEQELPGALVGKAALPMDITVRRADGRVYAIDVTIAEPAAPTYVTVGSAREEDVAAMEREKDKWAGYKTHYGETGAPGVTFVPFAVEATGRVGPIALDFLDDTMGVNHQGPLELFYKRMSAEVARWNSRMIQSARNRISRVGELLGGAIIVQ